jgi:hypothetical protein
LSQRMGKTVFGDIWSFPSFSEGNKHQKNAAVGGKHIPQTLPEAHTHVFHKQKTLQAQLW